VAGERQGDQVMHARSFDSLALLTTAFFAVIIVVAVNFVYSDGSIWQNASAACRPGNAENVARITSGGCQMIEKSR
jgi:hypothetical protein